MQATLHIKDDDFIEEYQRFGYRSKSAMVNDALEKLKIEKLEAYRLQLKDEMLTAYKPSDSWEGLKDDDFED